MTFAPEGTAKLLNFSPIPIDAAALLRWLEARCREALADEAAAKAQEGRQAEEREQQAFGEYLAYSRVLDALVKGAYRAEVKVDQN